MSRLPLPAVAVMRAVAVIPAVAVMSCAPSAPPEHAARADDAAPEGPAAAKSTVRIEKVAAGGGGTCAITSKKRLACWGAAGDGQIGNGVPYAHLGIEPAPVWVEKLRSVEQVAVGGATSVALTTDGKLFTWGTLVVARREGMTGNHKSATFWEPQEGPSVPGALQIEGGAATFFAVTKEGKVLGWGNGSNYVLGGLRNLVQKEPAAIDGLTSVRQVASATLYTCALDGPGVIACWGIVGNSVIGDLPTIELGPGDAKSVGAKLELSDDGARKMWEGFSKYGLTPVRGIANATQIDVGSNHGCALVPGGSVYCWGEGKRMQLGNGKAVDKGGPVRVHGIDDAIQVGAGHSESCALSKTGHIHCWGQVGLGTEPTPRPKKIAGLKNIASFSMGLGHACAVDRDGALYCWGSNRFGELGLGFASLQEPPTRVELTEDPPG